MDDDENDGVFWRSLLVETAGLHAFGSTPANQPARQSDISAMTRVQFEALEAAFNLATGYFGANQNDRIRNTTLFYTMGSDSDPPPT